MKHSIVWSWRVLWFMECAVAAVSLVLVLRAYHQNWANSKVLARYPNSQSSRRLSRKRRQSRVWLLLSAVQVWCSPAMH
jgi:hypothetical protein